MKRVFLACFITAMLHSAQAQLFGPESLTGAWFGGLIGGIVGGDHHHGYYHHYHEFSGQGAAIGAGVGLLAGAIAGEARRQEYNSRPYVYAPAPAVGYDPGSSAAPVVASPYVYHAPNYYCAPGYYYQPTRPNYAVSGTLLGAASGALIGEGVHHQAGEGAAIGAAAGLVLGGITEYAAQKRERAGVPAQPASPPQPQTNPSPQSAPQAASPQIVPAHHAQTVAAPPGPSYQIPDAPRVPDAPRF